MNQRERIESEIESAANELDQIFRQRHKHSDVVSLLKDLANALAVHLRSTEADQRDAARYRWLRDCDGEKVPITLWELVDDGSWAGGNALKQEERLDAAIDAAMSARSGDEER